MFQPEKVDSDLFHEPLDDVMKRLNEIGQETFEPHIPPKKEVNHKDFENIG